MKYLATAAFAVLFATLPAMADEQGAPPPGVVHTAPEVPPSPGWNEPEKPVTIEMKQEKEPVRREFADGDKIILIDKFDNKTHFVFHDKEWHLDDPKDPWKKAVAGEPVDPPVAEIRTEEKTVPPMAAPSEAFKAVTDGVSDKWNDVTQAPKVAPPSPPSKEAEKKDRHPVAQFGMDVTHPIRHPVIATKTVGHWIGHPLETGKKMRENGFNDLTAGAGSLGQVGYFVAQFFLPR